MNKVIKAGWFNKKRNCHSFYTQAIESSVVLITLLTGKCTSLNYYGHYTFQHLQNDTTVYFVFH